MRWLGGYEEKDIYKNIPHLPATCHSCGRKWFYYTDIPEGEYRIKCPICNHILHVKVKEKR